MASESDNDAHAGGSAREPVIVATELRESYGDIRAVDGVSFELHAGVLVARLREYEASVRRERADL